MNFWNKFFKDNNYCLLPTITIRQYITSRYNIGYRLMIWQELGGLPITGPWAQRAQWEWGVWIWLLYENRLHRVDAIHSVASPLHSTTITTSPQISCLLPFNDVNNLIPITYPCKRPTKCILTWLSVSQSHNGL